MIWPLIALGCTFAGWVIGQASGWSRRGRYAAENAMSIHRTYQGQENERMKLLDEMKAPEGRDSLNRLRTCAMNKRAQHFHLSTDLC